MEYKEYDYEGHAIFLQGIVFKLVKALPLNQKEQEEVKRIVEEY